jgi:hypothetical protein
MLRQLGTIQEREPLAIMCVPTYPSGRSMVDQVEYLARAVFAHRPGHCCFACLGRELALTEKAHGLRGNCLLAERPRLP